MEGRGYVHSEGVRLCAAAVRHVGRPPRTRHEVGYWPDDGSEGQDADAAGHEEWLVTASTKETDEDQGYDETYRLSTFDQVQLAASQDVPIKHIIECE